MKQLRTRDAVLKAVKEFDELGREGFLARYGFRAARQYVLKVNGREYDSKAIVGAAHGYDYPENGPLQPSEFSGGVGATGAASQLIGLGFDVVDAHGLPAAKRPSGKRRREGRAASSAPADAEANLEAELPKPDLQRTLVVIPCSGSKRQGGQWPIAQRRLADVIDPDLRAELREARARVAGHAGLDERLVMPAYRRYSGALYEGASAAIADALSQGAHLLIISGGYGVVYAGELIGDYNQIFKPGDWRRNLAGRILADYVMRYRLDSVVAFLARTTSYAKVIRKAAWPPSVLRVDLVSPAHEGGGGLRIVPEVLGEAVSEHLATGLPPGWRSSRGIGLSVEHVVGRTAPPTVDAATAENYSEALCRVPASPAVQYELDRTLHNDAGLYAWFGDDHALASISEAAGEGVGPLLYVGQAGATNWPSGTPSPATIGSRIRTQHLGGTIGASTLRKSLAALLRGHLKLTPAGSLSGEDERKLTEFIRRHLRVGALVVEERERLGAIEAAVVGQLDPPLNLIHVKLTAGRQRIRELRSRLAAEPGAEALPASLREFPS